MSQPADTLAPASLPSGSRLGGLTVVGRSTALLEAVAMAGHLAQEEAPGALLVGEPGTGKELLARAMHYAAPGASEPFLAIGCVAMPEAMLASELFGLGSAAGDEGSTRRGLLELAGRGTVFIDEITRLSPALQAAVQLAVEERRILRDGVSIPIRCRVVAATTSSLAAALARGELHGPLYGVLAAARIDLPPLRERGDDLELLAEHFACAVSGSRGIAVRRLEPAALQALASHPWAGNVRELRHVIERAAVHSDGPVIRAEHLVMLHRTARSGASAETPAAAEIRIPRAGKQLSDIEAEAVVVSLQLTGGNRSAAARLLGISRPTLTRILRRPAAGGREQ